MSIKQPTYGSFTMWTKQNNKKTNENEKLIEKLVGLVEKLNERVSSLENTENEKWTKS